MVGTVTCGTPRHCPLSLFFWGGRGGAKRRANVSRVPHGNQKCQVVLRCGQTALWARTKLGGGMLCSVKKDMHALFLHLIKRLCIS